MDSRVLHQSAAEDSLLGANSASERLNQPAMHQKKSSYCYCAAAACVISIFMHFNVLPPGYKEMFGSSCYIWVFSHILILRLFRLHEADFVHHM